MGKRVLGKGVVIPRGVFLLRESQECTRGVMIPAPDPDAESDFQLLAILKSDSNSVKSRIVTPIEVL